MTTSAWVMLVITWSVIISFTGYFFMKVIRTPVREEGRDQGD